MEIIGFLFVLVVAAAATAGFFGVLLVDGALGGGREVPWYVMWILVFVIACLWYFAFTNAPFSISFEG